MEWEDKWKKNFAAITLPVNYNFKIFFTLGIIEIFVYYATDRDNVISICNRKRSVGQCI